MKPKVPVLCPMTAIRPPTRNLDIDKPKLISESKFENTSGPSGNIQPLPGDIHLEILSNLSITQLYESRGVCRWYRHVCLNHFRQRLWRDVHFSGCIYGLPMGRSRGPPQLRSESSSAQAYEEWRMDWATWANKGSDEEENVIPSPNLEVPVKEDAGLTFFKFPSIGLYWLT